MLNWTEIENEIRRTNGVTFRYKNGEVKVLECDKGFIVSIGSGLRFPFTKDLSVMFDEAYRYIKERGNGLYGFYVDKGSIYLDSNLWVLDKETALKIGKENNQISLWDCKRKKEVRI